MSTHEIQESHQTETASPQLSQENSSGASFPPPPLNLGGGGDDNPIQRKEDPQMQTFQPTEVAQRQDDGSGTGRLDDPEHPDHTNPLLNSNTAYQNIHLAVEEWRAQGGTDNRALAITLANILYESGGTFHSLNEGFDGAGAFADGGTNENYAAGGFWGRGMVQTTHQAGYYMVNEAIPGIDLNENYNQYLLPTISAPLAVNTINSGIYSVGIEGDSMQTYLDNNDIQGSRNLVAPTAGADERVEYEGRVNRILTAINSYDPSSGQTLAEYLYYEVQDFRATWDADANRILTANGMYNGGVFPGGEFGADGTTGAEYEEAIEATGYAPFLKTFSSESEVTALIQFQVMYNQTFQPSPALNEEGVLDEPTMQALLTGGWQISSGQSMIDFVNGTENGARNLMAEAFQEFGAGGAAEGNIATLGSRVISYQPMNPISLEAFHSGWAGLDLAQQGALATYIALNAQEFPGLAAFNPEILPLLQFSIPVGGTDPDQQRALNLLNNQINGLDGNGEAIGTRADAGWVYHVIREGDDYPSSIPGQYQALSEYQVTTSDLYYPNGTSVDEAWGGARPAFRIGDVIIVRLNEGAELPFGVSVSLQRTAAPGDDVYFP